MSNAEALLPLLLVVVVAVAVVTVGVCIVITVFVIGMCSSVGTLKIIELG
jgi:hypothetical protein